MKRLICEVVEIKSKYPVYKLGNRITTKESEVDLKEINRSCIHALLSILYYAVALREDVDPKILEQCMEGKHAYIHFVDHRKLYCLEEEPYILGCGKNESSFNSGC